MRPEMRKAKETSSSASIRPLRVIGTPASFLSATTVRTGLAPSIMGSTSGRHAAGRSAAIAATRTDPSAALPTLTRPQPSADIVSCFLMWFADYSCSSTGDRRLCLAEQVTPSARPTLAGLPGTTRQQQLSSLARCSHKPWLLCGAGDDFHIGWNPDQSLDQP